MMNADNSVVFKMHLIKIAPDTYEQYLNANRGSLITAVAIEDGTFGMYASHQPDDLTSNYLFEVFDNQEAYKEHVSSGQYQQFKQEMDGVITKHDEIDLVPQFMGHQNVALNISTPNDLWVNIVRMTVATDHQAEYKKAVTAELQGALSNDPGMLAVYVGTEEGKPNEWVIYEVFQSEDNYRQHVADPAYQAYKDNTKQWVENKDVKQTIGDVLVNQNNN